MLQHKPGPKTIQATGISGVAVSASSNKTGNAISHDDTHAVIQVIAEAPTAATIGKQLYVYVLFDGESGGDLVDPARPAIGSIGASGGTAALVEQFEVPNLHGRSFSLLIRNEWNQTATVTVTCETFSYGWRP